MPSSPLSRSTRRLLLAFGLAGAMLGACNSSRGSATVAAPQFELKDLNGNTVRLESFLGHPVLLDFWATWCGPCRMSIPLVQQFYMHHKSDGLIVLGMNLDDDASGVPAFVKKFEMTYPILLAGNTAVASDYEIEGIPHFVFIDARGRVQRIYQGFSPEIVRNWEDDFKAAQKKTQ